MKVIKYIIYTLIKKEELVDLVLFEREEAYRQYVASDFYHHLEGLVLPYKIKKAA